jgi:hypothetical protein
LLRPAINNNTILLPTTALCIYSLTFNE